MINLEKISEEIRNSTIKMIFRSQSAHLGSGLSSVEILTVLFFCVMNIDSKNPDNPKRDKFILSKGHAASVFYATLAERGFFDKKILEKYYNNGESLPGHASYRCLPGVEVSTGSLGHGLPMANGMAFSQKVDGIKSKTFVLLSDGECDEGSNWEAALFASHHKLDNLVVIIDYNKLQGFGRTKDILNLEPLVQKWVSFGWSVKEGDGHNLEEMLINLKKIPFEKNKPSLFIAHTIKGKGILSMEDKIESHYRPPTKEEFEGFFKNNL